MKLQTSEVLKTSEVCNFKDEEVREGVDEHFDHQRLIAEVI